MRLEGWAYRSVAREVTRPRYTMPSGPDHGFHHSSKSLFRFAPRAYAFSL
jgi:hypothetical protein